MKKPKPITIDFETFQIEGRPAYPPLPVGVSIKHPGKKARYYAWGHPTGNNCGYGDAQKALRDAWLAGEAGDGLLFQNAKFDLDVAQTHMGMWPIKWSSVHDTLFLLFLDDPHQKELGLKPSAERLLGLKPEEQDAIGVWLTANQPIPWFKIGTGKQGDHYFGKYTAYAPGDLVADYANGDVDRTSQLFDLLYPRIVERAMVEAYDRERRLMPCLLDMERHGVPVDAPRLARDVLDYTLWRDTLTNWLIDTLKAPDDLNLNSGDQLVKALIKAKKIDTSKLGVTATGKHKTDKDSLMAAVTDKTVLAVLKYRTQLGTCLQTFMEPWLLTAQRSGGRIYTQWNQVKGDVGTRSGRLSSTPNFQNIPNTFKPLFDHEAPKTGLPKCPFPQLPPLPMVRSYITAEKGHYLIDRDYSQQELRILAHFESGRLLLAYQADPWMDVHDFAKDLVSQLTGKPIDRKTIKNTNFGLLYGMGVGKLAEKNGLSVELSKQVRDAVLAVFPGLKAMQHTMKQRAIANEAIRTWGGREYFCEEPKVIDGQLRSFDYKLINYLIQGSAADCTKEAVIAYYDAKGPDDRLLVNVHDQLLCSVPKSKIKAAMKTLKEAMEDGVEFDVPMYSEGRWSNTNWSDLKTYDKKGIVEWQKP